jgi:phenylalanyl-tRNA synthetase beta chain
VGADARADGREPDEHRILGILVAGAGSPPLWQEPARAADLGDLKGLLEATVERLAPGTRLRFGPAEPRPGIDHPGRVSTVLAIPPADEGAPATDPVGLGTVGELHPRLLEAFDIRTEHVLAAELDLAPLLSLVPERRRVELLERLPAVERDIALVVKASAPAGDIAEAIRDGAGGASIASVILFDRYQGPPLAADEVNLAFRLRFQGSDSTISEAALDGTIERLRGVLAERFGARLRD